MTLPTFTTVEEEKAYWRTVSLKLAEVEFTHVTTQWEAIRKFASEQGFADLRGFHMWLRAERMTYYDVLEEVSP